MVYSPVNAWTFPVNPNFPWRPDIAIITAITNAFPAIITTAQPHGYSSGFNVRVVFPFPYALYFGMDQINEQIGTIQVLSPTTFSISIDTTNYDPFIIGTTLQSPQVIPIGQYTNIELDDSSQVNPSNPQVLSQVPLFQKPGLQAPGACSTSQT
jgi:hypothetical protein